MTWKGWLVGLAVSIAFYGWALPALVRVDKPVKPAVAGQAFNRDAWLDEMARDTCVLRAQLGTMHESFPECFYAQRERFKRGYRK